MRLHVLLSHLFYQATSIFYLSFSAVGFILFSGLYETRSHSAAHTDVKVMRSLLPYSWMMELHMWATTPSSHTLLSMLIFSLVVPTEVFLQSLLQCDLVWLQFHWSWLALFYVGKKFHRLLYCPCREASWDFLIIAQRLQEYFMQKTKQNKTWVHKYEKASWSSLLALDVPFYWVCLIFLIFPLSSWRRLKASRNLELSSESIAHSPKHLWVSKCVLCG